MKSAILALTIFSLSITFLWTAGYARAADSDKQKQSISLNGTRPSGVGSHANFTGNVRHDPLFRPNDAAPFSGSYVTFEPGARTFWHTHPAGQRLIVISGLGLTGTEDGKIWEIRPGDVVWCPPNVKHWHGASPTTSMTHLALTGMKDGKNVTWLEEVSDEQYARK